MSITGAKSSNSELIISTGWIFPKTISSEDDELGAIIPQHRIAKAIWRIIFLISIARPFLCQIQPIHRLLQLIDWEKVLQPR